MEQIKSAFLKLNSNDFIRGLVVSVLAAVLTGIQQMLTSGFDWTQLWHIALVSGLSYLSKNLLTDSDGKVLGAI